MFAFLPVLGQHQEGGVVCFVPDFISSTKGLFIVEGDMQGGKEVHE